jgi:hypothetical protein
MYVYIRKLNNNRVMKNKSMDNYPNTPLKNGRLTHVNPKLYTKCLPRSLINMKSRYKSYSQHEMQLCLVCHCFPFVVSRLGND